MFSIMEYVTGTVQRHWAAHRTDAVKPDAPLFLGRSMMLIDEAWHLIRRDQTGEYANDLARRARHLGLALIVMSQQLSDFNTEYGDPTPPPDAMAVRVRQLLAAGDTRILLGGAGPHGIAVLRFRSAIWSTGLECYLAELYVAPAERGRGLGRALMEAAIALARDAGADTMDLGTNETDTAARALYESLGFTQLEDGPVRTVRYYVAPAAT